MHVSINEIDAAVRKAARGAGLSWGQAEEAGKAARKLVEHGFEALRPLADVLESHSAGGGIASRIDHDRGNWRGSHGPLSPLVLGPVIADHAGEIRNGRVITTGPVVHPVLLIPFVITVARTCQRPAKIEWPSSGVVVWPNGACGGDVDHLIHLTIVATVTCRSAEECDVRNSPDPAWLGACVDPDLWQRFERLAHLTYVPASDLSRRRGAGGGEIDND